LILDDAPGQALTVHMARPQMALTIDQKWRVAKDLLAALNHAHRKGVIHRNLTPSALIVGVLCDSAAASAGMVPGDVITSVDRQPVTTPGSLTTITGKYHPGDVVSVLWVSLNGIEHTTKMQLGEGPAR